jgi:hypothetical protein
VKWKTTVVAPPVTLKQCPMAPDSNPEVTGPSSMAQVSEPSVIELSVCTVPFPAERAPTIIASPARTPVSETLTVWVPQAAPVLLPWLINAGVGVAVGVAVAVAVAVGVAVAVAVAVGVAVAVAVAVAVGVAPHPAPSPLTARLAKPEAKVVGPVVSPWTQKLVVVCGVLHDVLKVTVGSPLLQEGEVVVLSAKVTPVGGVYVPPGVDPLPAVPTILQVTVPPLDVQLTE